ncbi:MAG: Na(+)/H(+) antiporter subunit D [bacterium]
MMNANSFDILLTNSGVLFTLGAFVTLILPAWLRRYFMLGIIGLSAAQLMGLALGNYGAYQLMGWDLTLTRYDSLSRLFVIVFHIAAALNVIYGWHVKDRVESFTGLAYPGAALGGVLAGDWLTLFIWWELAALTSVFLVLAPRTRRTYMSAMRYLAVQISSGVLLLAGVVALSFDTHSMEFTALSLRNEIGGLNFAAAILFIAIGIKAAFPFLHNWVQDAYPKSNVTGTIMLSVFTTKLAVYSLARGFAGTPELIWIGAVMTIFPIFFALIENDLKRVLTYSINNQVGFMVVGIGVGTPIALNGAVGYAFGNIIFESLLFMSLGAVIYRTGTSKATELGGIYRTMPLTMTLCIIGALSISAFPGTLGFVTKGLIIDGVAEGHIFVIWLILLFASAGVLEHAGIKIPFFTFFAHDSGKRPAESPLHMLIAMGISAFMCIYIGLNPEPLYNLLPYQEQIAEYHPYSSYHIVEQLQLLLFAVLAFAVLIKMKWYPPEVPSTNLDFDWFYRVPGRNALAFIVAMVAATWHFIWGGIVKFVSLFLRGLYQWHGPEGTLARTWPIGFMALFTGIMLLIVLLATLFGFV